MSTLRVSEELPELSGFSEPSWCMTGLGYVWVTLTILGTAVGRQEWWVKPPSQELLLEKWGEVRAVLGGLVADRDWRTVRVRATQEVAELAKRDDDESTAKIVAKLDQLLERRPESQRWLTLKQAALYTGMAEHSLRRWIQEGDLTAHNPTGSKVLLDIREIDSFVATNTRTSLRGAHLRRDG